jgi:hypothetical protein
MKIASLAGVTLALSFALVPARAADDPGLARMATCRDSWFDWSKSDPVQMKKFVDHIRTGFTPHDNDPYFLPKAETSIMGLHVTQVYPESVGMGVGFSLIVDAPFDKTRKIFEKALGKPLGKCEASDGMNACELPIAEKRDFTLMAEDSPKSTTTLVGCYYFYEK